MKEEIEEAFKGFWVVEEESERGKFEEEVFKRLKKVFPDLKKEEMRVYGDAGITYVEVRGFVLSFNEEWLEFDEYGDVKKCKFNFYGVGEVRT